MVVRQPRRPGAAGSNELQGLTSDRTSSQEPRGRGGLHGHGDEPVGRIRRHGGGRRGTRSIRASSASRCAPPCRRSRRENALLTDVPNDALVVMAQQGLDASIADAVDQIETISTSPRCSPTPASPVEGGVVDSLTGDIALTALPGVGWRDTVGSLPDRYGATRPRSVTPRTTSSSSSQSDSAASDGGGKDSASSSAEWRTENYAGRRGPHLGRSPDESLIGVSYAVIDGAGVIALTPDAMHAVIDAQQGGDRITTSSAYADAMDGMPERRASPSTWTSTASPTRSARTLPPDQAGRVRPVRGRDHGSTRLVRGGARSSPRSTSTCGCSCACG